MPRQLPESMYVLYLTFPGDKRRKRSLAKKPNEVETATCMPCREAPVNRNQKRQRRKLLSLNPPPSNYTVLKEEFIETAG